MSDGLAIGGPIWATVYAGLSVFILLASRLFPGRGYALLGGAVSRVPADETAYAHRDRRIMANVAAMFQSPHEASQHEKWVVGLATALQDGPGAYVNFLNDDGDERIHEAYPGSTYERLRQVKREYDPDNLFRLNQNIPPGTQPR